MMKDLSNKVIGGLVSFCLVLGFPIDSVSQGAKSWAGYSSGFKTEIIPYDRSEKEGYEEFDIRLFYDKENEADTLVRLNFQDRNSDGFPEVVLLKNNIGLVDTGGNYIGPSNASKFEAFYFEPSKESGSYRLDSYIRRTDFYGRDTSITVREKNITKESLSNMNEAKEGAKKIKNLISNYGRGDSSPIKNFVKEEYKDHLALFLGK